MKLTRRDFLKASAVAITVPLAAPIFKPLTSVQARSKQPPPPPPTPVYVTLSFDDCKWSAYKYGAPVLAIYGLTATMFVITGMVTNSNGNSFATWPQMKQLERNNGWEMGSHTVDHPDLTTLTTDQVTWELAQSKAEMIANGLGTPISFAFPYNDYNDTVLALTKQYYPYPRLNSYPQFSVPVLNIIVTPDMTPTSITSQIQAAPSGSGVNLQFHNIFPDSEALDANTEYHQSDLKTICKFLYNSGNKISVLTFAQWYKKLSGQT